MGKPNSVKVPGPGMRLRVNDAPICRDFLSGRGPGPRVCAVGRPPGRKPGDLPPSQPDGKHAGGMLGEMRRGRLFGGVQTPVFSE